MDQPLGFQQIQTIPCMSRNNQLQDTLLQKNQAGSSRSHQTIDVKWLSDLFDPDNINSKQSNKRLERLGGYEGLERVLKNSRKNGISASSDDKAQRNKKYGNNDPIVKEPKTLWEMILSTFEDQTIQILCFAAIASLVLGIMSHGLKSGWLEGVSIILAVSIISAVTAGNEYMKDKQFRKLNEVASRKNVNVVRKGEIINMSVYELLVGDVVQVETGEIISVDGIIFNGNKMSTDESSVTGQTDQIHKEDFKVGVNNNPFLVSGSKVMEGTGYMIVLAIGKNSRQGINRSKLQKQEDDTPLQEKLAGLADQIGKIGIGSATLTFLALLIHLIVDIMSHGKCVFCYQTMNVLVSYFIIAVSIVVIAVPEGLPLAVTISLAYSVGKMKEENNLVRFLAACETMGGANNICTDKTGTLTQNQMTVTRLWSEGGILQSFGKGPALTQNTLNHIANNVALNSNAMPKVKGDDKFEQLGNKTECSLLEMAYKWGYDFRDIRKKYNDHIVATVPFSSSRKRMSCILDIDSKYYIYSKGAPDLLLPECAKYVAKNGELKTVDQDFKDLLKFNLNQFAAGSLRTLLICYKELTKKQAENQHPEQNQNGLIILGLAGIKDPLKKGIPEAVNKCKQAGIIVRMVTGDIKETAVAIAKDANIIPHGYQRPEKGQSGYYVVMEGKQFREAVGGLIEDPQHDKDHVGNIEVFKKISKELRVLARSSPQDKYLLATGLKELGHVVAMTGDGGNDAPALKKADIGFAMGIAGVEMAKQAAGIILLDDNFGSIVTAAKYGRNIFDCIRKFLQFQLTVNIVAIFMAFLGAVLIKESPLTPVQMLWVNLIMDTLAALALATEPPSEDLLLRMPYSRTENIITPLMWRNIILHAIFQMCVLSIVLFMPQLFGVPSSLGLQIDQWNPYTGVHLSIFFDTFVFLQVFNFFNARKLKKDEVNIFKEIGDNYLFILIVVSIFACQLLIVQVGGRALKLVPLTMNQHLTCICIGALSLVWGFLIKTVIPEGILNSIQLLREERGDQHYNVDSGLERFIHQPATERRSSRHRR